MRSDWLHDLYYFLRRACYFLLGKRQFKVRINTHPWAWFVPLGAPVQTFIPLESAPAGSPGLDLEITPAFGMNEAAAHRFVRRFVATLRHLHPQASFTAVSWQGKDAWDTHTFAMENADGEKEKALLGKLEHLHQTFFARRANDPQPTSPRPPVQCQQPLNKPPLISIASAALA